jgi:uncharacterized lipoprotein YajG
MKNIFQMKKMIFILVLLLAGCEVPQNIQHQNRNIDSFSQIFYLRDTRTDLCFATNGEGSSRTLTEVPCNEKVMRIIDGS